MSSVLFLNKDIAEISANDFEGLKASALQAPLKRARICLHQSHHDPIQEMIIVFAQGSYIRPHRHSNKVESLFIIEGKLEVVFFDDSGEIIHRIIMERSDASSTILYRLSKDYWHTVIPLTEFVIIHEITQGPFLKNQDDFAPWSPQDNDYQAVTNFLSSISIKILT